MRGWRSEKVSTIREEFDEIYDSMKGSSSRMKNKVGAQKGAFIKMKQENMYIYQMVFVVCYVPLIGTSNHATLRDIHQFRKSALCHICAIPRQECVNLQGMLCQVVRC